MRTALWRLRSNRLLGRCFEQDEPRPVATSAFPTHSALAAAHRLLGARRDGAVAAIGNPSLTCGRLRFICPLILQRPNA